MSVPLYERVVAVVAEERERHGQRHRRPGVRPSPTDLEAEMGLHRKWFQRMRRGQYSLDLARAEEYLRATGADVELAMATAIEHGEGRVVAALRRHAGKSPMRPAPRRVTPVEHEGHEAALVTLNARLDDIDARRVAEPSLALRDVRRVAKDVERATQRETTTATARLYSRACLVYGSTAWHAAQLHLAASCYLEGLDAAVSWHFTSEHCDLLLRSSSLLRDLLEPGAAAEAAQLAAAFATSLDDMERLANALYQQAHAAHMIGGDATALLLFRAAGAGSERLLAPSIAARSYLLLNSGKIEEALGLADRAERELRQEFSAYPDWIRAEAYLALDRAADAIIAARRAIEKLPETRRDDRAMLLLISAAAAARIGALTEATTFVNAAERALLPIAGTPLGAALLDHIRHLHRPLLTAQGIGDLLRAARRLRMSR